MVGSAFARAAARRGHRVTGVAGIFSGEIAGLERKNRLDLTDETATSVLAPEFCAQRAKRSTRS